MNKIISLFVVVAVLIGCASAKPEPKPDVLAYNVAGVPVVAAAPTVASYATVYEHSYHGNLAPASYVAYSTYDPFVPYTAVPVGASILLRK
uniref:Uncharacterized protein n=1 Tax=Anopheles farauti TaxID=69004 RepID=A0A182QGW6_9DIPT